MVSHPNWLFLGGISPLLTPSAKLPGTSRLPTWQNRMLDRLTSALFSKRAFCTLLTKLIFKS